MVFARLHIICGNCGNGDKEEFENRIEDGQIYISCQNCATLHTLEVAA